MPAPAPTAYAIECSCGAHRLPGRPAVRHARADHSHGTDGRLLPTGPARTRIRPRLARPVPGRPDRRAARTVPPVAESGDAPDRPARRIARRDLRALARP